MADFELTKVDTGSVVHGQDEALYADEVLDSAALSAALLAGTLLARHTGTGQLQLYVKGGSSNGNGVVCCVLTYAVPAGAADVPVRVLVNGSVNKNRLVIAADGDSSNVDGAVMDLCRARGITPLDVEQLPQAEPELS